MKIILIKSLKEEYTPKLFSEENNDFNESEEKDTRENDETESTI